MKDDPKGTFWCSCADHKFNSGKKNIVCKHICFIVCKVLKILQPYFFETKTLKPEHLQQLLDKFNDCTTVWDMNILYEDYFGITMPIKEAIALGRTVSDTNWNRLPQWSVKGNGYYF